MNLTRKDFYATLLATAVLAVTYSVANKLDLGFITGVRSATIVVGLLGIAMCSLNSPAKGEKMNMSDPWVEIATFLGAVSIIAIVVGLVTGNPIAFITLAAATMVLWGTTTIHHLVGRKTHKVRYGL